MSFAINEENAPRLSEFSAKKGSHLDAPNSRIAKISNFLKKILLFSTFMGTEFLEIFILKIEKKKKKIVFNERKILPILDKKKIFYKRHSHWVAQNFDGNESRREISNFEKKIFSSFLRR